MKNVVTLCIIVLLFSVACQHATGPGQDFESEGNILGPDLGMCIICGGWFIEIEDEIYHFGNLPPGSGIDLGQDTFPIHVLLNWHEDPVPTWITIESIVKL